MVTRPSATRRATGLSQTLVPLLRYHRSRRLASASLLIWLSSLGCGAKETPRESSVHAAGVEQHGADAVPLAGPPRPAHPKTASQLLVRLGESHAVARERLGSHALRCAVEIDVTPGSAREHPPSGGISTAPQSVQDTFELDYRQRSKANDESTPEEDAFRLLQRDSRGTKREVRTNRDLIFVRFHDREWVHHARDSDLLDVWLTDAFHCVFDIVSLAGTGLVIHPRAPQNPSKTTQIQYDVGLRDNSPFPMASQSPSGPESWRTGSMVTRLSGSVSLNRTTGIWEQASIELEFRASPREPRAGSATGRVRVNATLESLTTPPRWPIPETSTPMPSRRRLTHEAQTLLNGLAGP